MMVSWQSVTRNVPLGKSSSPRTTVLLHTPWMSTIPPAWETQASAKHATAADPSKPALLCMLCRAENVITKWQFQAARTEMPQTAAQPNPDGRYKLALTLHNSCQREAVVWVAFSGTAYHGLCRRDAFAQKHAGSERDTTLPGPERQRNTQAATMIPEGYTSS